MALPAGPSSAQVLDEAHAILAATVIAGGHLDAFGAAIARLDVESHLLVEPHRAAA